MKNVKNENKNSLLLAQAEQTPIEKITTTTILEKDDVTNVVDIDINRSDNDEKKSNSAHDMVVISNASETVNENNNADSLLNSKYVNTDELHETIIVDEPKSVEMNSIGLKISQSSSDFNEESEQTLLLNDYVNNRKSTLNTTTDEQGENLNECCSSSVKQNMLLVSENEKYRVESPTSIKSEIQTYGNRIQELSDNNSSIASNDNTPIVSEVDSETEQKTNETEKSKIFIEPYSPIELNLRQSSLQETQAPKILQPPPPSIRTHFYLQPMNYLQAISEESCDASEYEQCSDVDDKLKTEPNPKVLKANAIYPHSVYDFSHIGRHTHLIAPKNEVIREEPPCILVDTKLVDQETDVSENEKQNWQSKMANTQHFAELVYLDSNSSGTSLSDFESVTGVDADIEDSHSESDVHIASPIIGSNIYSAFAPVGKKSSDNKSLLGARQFSTQASSSSTSSNQNEKEDLIDKPTNAFLQTDQIELIHSDEKTFKPINDVSGSLLSLIQSLAAASSMSSPIDEVNNSKASYDNKSVDSSTDNENIFDSTSNLNVHSNEWHDFVRHTNNNSFDTRTSTNTNTEQSQNNADEQLTKIDFKIGELCINNMFNVNTNFIQNNFKNNNYEFNRQDSSSSPTTTSTAQSQCTAKYITGHTPSNELIDHFKLDRKNKSLKSLRQICVEYLDSIPYGQAILNELERAAKHLNSIANQQYCLNQENEMPYPPPKLPDIGHLEIQSEFLHRPQPPQRAHRSKVKLITNFSTKTSPPPPPVPDRPWLAIPTANNPNVLVCLSPAQGEQYQDTENSRTYYRYNSTPDRLLDMHNKFIDRRGYFEYTDDEIKSLNLRKTSTTPTTNAKHNISATTTNEDNRLLALIREINQLTNTNENTPTLPSMHQEKICENKISNDLSLADKNSTKTDRNSTETMSFSSSQISNTLHSKRFSSYFDELNRLHPIAEETPKRYSKSNFESCKRTENGEVVYDYELSERTVETDDKTAKSTGYSTDHQNKLFDSNIDRPLNETKKFDTNSVENHFLRCKDVNKNSCSNDAIKQTSENKPIESSQQKCDLNNEQQVNSSDQSGFSFRDFDFVPKFFTNFFRSNKSDAINENCLTATEPTNSTNSMMKTNEQIDQTNENENEKIMANSLYPIRTTLKKSSERHASTQSLHIDWPSDLDTSSPSNISVKSVNFGNRGRISPCIQIRAPRISDEPKASLNENQRDYYLHSPKKNRCCAVNYQSMVDQTPITRHVTPDRRRQSLPREISDNQYAYILEKEKELNAEFDKLERDRIRLLNELEEIQVNERFERFHKEHKKNNLGQEIMSQADLLRKQVQDEWLSKVAEREERRLQKIIKVNYVEGESPASKSITNRGLCDEFLDRVRERCTKLQIPSESESEPQPTSMCNQNLPTPIDVRDVKVLREDGIQADFKVLPKHLREFAEFVSKTNIRETIEEEHIECSNSFQSSEQEVISNIFESNNETVKKIDRCEKNVGEFRMDSW